MNVLHKKVAVVTGGNSGIGFVTAQTFAEAGAHVVIVGRRAEAVKEAEAVLGPRVTGIVGDVAELETHDAVSNLVRERFGQADIYMANAGSNIIAPTSAVSVEDYDAQFATNTRAVFFGVQKIIHVMREGGSILVVSSIASKKTLDGHAAYAGSKAAIEAFARSWALELNNRRIRVNVLSPGPVDTPILDKMGLPSDTRAGLEQHMARAIPLGRMGRPDEIARAALFLASNASSFVTGVNLRVDGGISLT